MEPLKLSSNPARAHSNKRKASGEHVLARTSPPDLAKPIQDPLAPNVADDSTDDIETRPEHGAAATGNQAAAAAARQPVRARKRCKGPDSNPIPAAAAAAVAASAVQANPDSPAAIEGCRHASGSAKKVVVSPDGSSSVEMSHRLSSKSSASQNFWLHMPSNLARNCFKDSQLPKDVSISLTVNDQPVEHSRPDVSNPIKSTVRRRPGRSEYYIAGYSSILRAYKNYIVHKMSVNSSSTEVTLHLQSPSVVEAAAAAEQEVVAAAVEAARADAAASGVVDWQECKGTKKVVSSTARRSLLRVPAALISKVFPAPLPAKFKVDLSFYKDNELIGIRPGAALTPDRKNYDRSSYSVLLSEDIQQQLAGCAVICHRAAPPKYLQLCFSSVGQHAAEEQQQPAAAAVEAAEVGGISADRAAAAVLPTAATASEVAGQPTTESPTGSPISALQEPSQQQQQQQQQAQVPSCADLQEQQPASCKWFPWAAQRPEGTPVSAPGSPAPAAAPAVTGSSRLGSIKGFAVAVMKM